MSAPQQTDGDPARDAGTPPRGHHRRAAQPASRHRPRRDPGVAGLPRRRRRPRRPRPRPLPDAPAARAQPRAAGRRARRCAAPTTSTPSRRSASRGSPATSTSSAASAPTSAGTPRSWCTARSGPGIAVGGHISSYASSASLYEVGFNHFFRGKDHPGGGDQICFQGHASPGIYARAFLEGRLHRAPARRLPPGGQPPRRRAVLLPAPAADAGLLGVPHRLDGPGPAQRDLPGAVQPLPARPRHQGHLRPARLGVPRRRRDGRARVARRDRPRRPRGARQPHLRHQLQPAAPRRPGARQRQDHPGAGVVLPRRRLERHQGDLGPRVGRRCSPPTATAPWST